MKYDNVYRIFHRSVRGDRAGGSVCGGEEQLVSWCCQKDCPYIGKDISCEDCRQEYINSQKWLKEEYERKDMVNPGTEHRPGN